MKDKDETVKILWNYKQEGKLRYLEWVKNGKTQMKRVTEEFYQTLVATPKQDTSLDFLD